MWLMLQQDEPDDFVISTNETHTVKEFVEMAFAEVGVTIVYVFFASFYHFWKNFGIYSSWSGTGVDEVGKDKATGIVRVKVNPKYYRPTEVVR